MGQTINNCRDAQQRASLQLFKAISLHIGLDAVVLMQKIQSLQITIAGGLVP